MDSTSAHGFHKINAGNRTVTNIFWIFVLTAGFCGLGYHLSTSVIKYRSYDYDDITELVFDIPDFPDVTICNMDAISSDR